MPKFKDLKGKTFGKLKAVKPIRKVGDKAVFWVCICDCGNTKNVRAYALTKGDTKSCGCEQYNRTPKHGMVNTREYRVWADMIQRCTNPNIKNFPIYGGRGINVCKRWKASFEAFFRDMGYRPTSNHSIERKDVNKGYNKQNCTWALRSQQARNTTRNVYFHVGSEKVIMKDFAIMVGVSPPAVRGYLKTHTKDETVAHYLKIHGIAIREV